MKEELGKVVRGKAASSQGHLCPEEKERQCLVDR